MPKTLLSTRNLGRRIDSSWIWKQVATTVAATDSIALLGPSGSGKTLLMRALALLDPIDSGVIFWREEEISHPPTFRSKCIYLQQRATLPDGTVEESLQSPFLFAQHGNLRFDREQIVRWLNHLEREQSFLEKRVAKLSGGETQIVALLRALQLQPNVMLLDEPTSALDSSTALLVEGLLTDWLADPEHERAYVWVSHDRDQADRVANRCWKLEGGTLNEESFVDE